MSTTTSPNYTQPALMGGAVMGVLSALPLIAAGNVCCCLWVVSGGLVAAYVFQQNQAAPMAPGDGALVGLLAGLFGAFVHLVLSIPIDILMAPIERAMTQRFFDMAGGMSPEVRDMFDRFAGSRAEASVGIILVRRAIAFVFMLFIGAMFSTVGGLLGAALFRKQTPAVDVTPTK
ncbi:MAG: hypothetical protein HY047_15105 [Acidobacteria bacterium]|nr:hypothetical protein [Acidobacteriota bacterium]